MVEKKKIKYEDLMGMLGDTNVSEKNLRKYFEMDDERSGPFAPVLKINEDTVEVSGNPDEIVARSALALNMANTWCRMRRLAAFHKRIASGYRGPIIVSEGDSWFQYPIRLDDVIDWLMPDYAILSLDAAGDTLKNMLEEGEYRKALTESSALIFLFSAGGNDLFGGGSLGRHLRQYDPATPNLRPGDYLLPSFNALIAEAVSGYDRLFREIERDFPEVTILCHGYDRPTPANGTWLGTPMADRGIVDAALQRAIVGIMFDRFNDELSRLAKTFGNTRFIDIRGVVTDWHDELHPTDDSFKKVAAKFDDVIKSLETPRARSQTGATMAASFRASAKASGKQQRSKARATALGQRTRKGQSLHIGLNSVDPTHYAGWQGTLGACEFDAEDMRTIATDMGFDTKSLITTDATRDAVIAEVERMAKELKAGDFCLVTYSGHGGQVPDYNKDEKEDNMDETWCLYDGQLIDDEQYRLWSEFEEGVRVLVLSDSCHSGSVVRAAMRRERLAFDAGAVGLRPRLMPFDIAQRVAHQNRAFYEKIGRSQPWGDENIIAKELSYPVRCSVRLISGCQDDEQSYEAMVNGAFTEALLQVWDSGRFQGTYNDFHRQIKQLVNSRQTPNHWTIGQANAIYDRQRPFEI